jgi:hypothetical protein
MQVPWKVMLLGKRPEIKRRNDMSETPPHTLEMEAFGEARHSALFDSPHSGTQLSPFQPGPVPCPPPRATS